MYNVSVSPHVRSKNTTKTIMRDVAIALIPTLAFGVYFFKLRALFVIALCVLSSVLSELVFELITKRTITVFDNSALVTGLILAVNLPASVPWFVPVLGGIFAIVIVKMLFGGLGQNFMNPALAARCFLLISFGPLVSNFTVADFPNESVDLVSAPTPLATIKSDGNDLMTLFLGTHGGTIGEVSAIAILIGACYLLVRKVISIRIPLTYILSTVVFIAIICLIKGMDISANFLLAEVLSGGLLVGAFFMATDYVTSPITPRGQIVFGILLGLMTALFRIVGSSAEGVSYAIIICNLLVPIIEKVTINKPFGSEKAKGDAK